MENLTKAHFWKFLKSFAQNCQERSIGYGKFKWRASYRINHEINHTYTLGNGFETTKPKKKIHMQWVFLISCTTEDLGWEESGLRTKHGKKGGVYLVENALWSFAKWGICLHLLVFSDRKIQGFSIVLLSVNLSIRSIIRYFPITVNPGKRLFSGIERSVNSWRMTCLPVFTDVFPV